MFLTDWITGIFFVIFEIEVKLLDFKTSFYFWCRDHSVTCNIGEDMNLLVQSPNIITSIIFFIKEAHILLSCIQTSEKKILKECVFSLSLDHECTSLSYLAKSLTPPFFKKKVFFLLNPHLTLPFNRQYVIAISEVYSVVSPFVYFDPIQH